MSAFDALVDELSVMADHREIDRRVSAINDAIDQAMQSGASAALIARMESIRNRTTTTPRIWQGQGA